MFGKATVVLSGAMLGAVGAVAFTAIHIFSDAFPSAVAADGYQQLNVFADVYEKVDVSLVPFAVMRPMGR